MLKGLREQLLLSEQCIDICIPLHHFGITYFHYIKSFKDNSRISLTNRPEWMEAYYSYEFYLSPMLSKEYGSYSNTYYLWGPDKNSEILNVLRRQFNVISGIVFIEVNKVSMQYYYFGMDQMFSSGLFSFSSMITSLGEFIVYFKSRCREKIEKALHNKIILPNEEHSRKATLDIFSQGVQKSKYHFPLMDLHDFYVTNVHDEDVSISRREAECAGWLSLGLSAKEIAKKLKISPRTVEKHLEHVRFKLGCCNKSEVINFLRNSPYQFLV